MTHVEETKVVTAHIPLPLVARVDELAAQLDRPRGWIVRQALSEWIANEDERDRLTRLALESVDAGRVVDHETVKAWAAGLK